jgi:hypothetical protein
MYFLGYEQFIGILTAFFSAAFLLAVATIFVSLLYRPHEKRDNRKEKAPEQPQVVPVPEENTTEKKEREEQQKLGLVSASTGEAGVIATSASAPPAAEFARPAPTAPPAYSPLTDLAANPPPPPPQEEEAEGKCQMDPRASLKTHPLEETAKQQPQQQQGSTSSPPERENNQAPEAMTGTAIEPQKETQAQAQSHLLPQSPSPIAVADGVQAQECTKQKQIPVQTMLEGWKILTYIPDDQMCPGGPNDYPSIAAAAFSASSASAAVAARVAPRQDPPRVMPTRPWTVVTI